MHYDQEWTSWLWLIQNSESFQCWEYIEIIILNPEEWPTKPKSNKVDIVKVRMKQMPDKARDIILTDLIMGPDNYTTKSYLANLLVKIEPLCTFKKSLLHFKLGTKRKPGLFDPCTYINVIVDQESYVVSNRFLKKDCNSITVSWFREIGKYWSKVYFSYHFTVTNQQAMQKAHAK